MVTNINYEELLDLRNKLVDNILSNFESWDGQIETGTDIIRANQEEIDKIETLNLQLSRFPEAQDQKYISKLNIMISEQRKLHEAIQNKQKVLLQNMQQLSKKDQVIKSYISVNKKSIFIDKDVK